MDTLSEVERSKRMRCVRRSQTGAELVVLMALRRMGYRCAANDSSLPGSPDIVIPRKKTAVFVHGCFWHRHRCRAGNSIPKTRTDFWLNKFRENRARDLKAARELRARGWHVLIAWECQLRGRRTEKTLKRLRRHLRVA